MRDAQITQNRPKYLRGKLQAARYFFDYELPKVNAWLSVVTGRPRVARCKRSGSVNEHFASWKPAAASDKAQRRTLRHCPREARHA
jgi:hypothetical protein